MDQLAAVGVNLSRYLKLFGREISFEVFQRKRKTYLNVTDRQTDGQTIYCGITVLCAASRGKTWCLTVQEEPMLDSGYRLWLRQCVRRWAFSIRSQ